MRRSTVLWVAFSMLSFRAAPAYGAHPQASGATPAARQVVVLYDERVSLPGLSQFDEGFVQALFAGANAPTDVYRESMDLSRFGTGTHVALLRDYLAVKYAREEIDAVVAVMGPALEFMATHGEDVFPGAAVVYAGLDERELAGRSLPDRATGVLLERRFSPTLELALQLHPDTRRVVFVAGTSQFDRRMLGMARNELRDWEELLEFRYLTTLPMDSLLAELAALPARTVVLYSTMFRDGGGRPFVPHEAARRISDAASAPVYGFVDQYVGYGLVGGRVYGMDRHGETAADLVLRILDGHPAAELEPVETGSTETVLDGRELRRWRVDEDRLPADAVVRFRRPSPWAQYADWVVAGVVLLGIQAMIIGALLAQRARRRRAEAELRDSEIRFRTMADSAPVLIWISDVDGHLVFVNRRWHDFTGTRADDLDERWHDRIHPDDRPHCRKAYDHGVARRETFAVECRLRRRDGTYRTVLLNGAPRTAGSAFFRGCIGSCMDVTEWKRAELEGKRHLEELARVTRLATMGELTASVAHELNQPLSAILGNAEAARLYLDRETPDMEEVRAALGDIRASGQRAGEIVRRTRGLLERHEVARRPLLVDGMIEEVLELVRLEAQASRVVIQFTPGPPDARVAGDRVHLQQVMMNLILNGLEAMNAVPESERRLEVRTADSGGDLLRITIADSGPGIPPEDLSTLFEPFHTTKAAGLGMGLSIARTIVDAHDGRVWAENAAGGGAMFHVELPRLADDAASRPERRTALARADD